MKWIAGAIGVLLLSAGTAVASSPGSQCLAFKSDTSRLGCFDNAMKTTSKPALEIAGKRCFQLSNEYARLECYDTEIGYGFAGGMIGSECKYISPNVSRTNCYKTALKEATTTDDIAPARACLSEERADNQTACLNATILWPLNPNFKDIATGDLNCADLTTTARGKDEAACREEFRRRSANAAGWTRRNNDWTASFAVSAFTDTTDVTLSLKSEARHVCRKGAARQEISLRVQCVEGATNVFLFGDCTFTSGHSGYGDVDVRVDKEQAFTVNMTADRTGKSLGLFGEETALPFLGEIMEAEQLLLRFAPLGLDPVIARFPTSGLKTEIEKVRQECGW